LAQNTSVNFLKDSLIKENLRATTFFDQSKYGESIELANKISLTAKENNFYSIQARSYCILGNSYHHLDRDSLSFSYLNKARDINLMAKDSIGLISTYNNIGANYMNLDSIQQSKYYFKNAIDIATKINHKEGLIYPTFNLGALAISVDKNYDEAIKYMNDALNIINEFEEDFKERGLVGDIYLNLYYCHFKIGDKKRSSEYFKKCKAFSEKYNYLNIQADIYFERALFDYEEKKYKDAFDYLEMFANLKDTINQIREFEKAKQVEADNFLRENKEKLILVQKEKEFHEESTAKANRYNLLLGIFSIGLIFSLYLAYRSNKRLGREKQRAEQLSKVKSAFYSEISHELRTPLYAVIEISRLLLKESTNDKHKEYLESLNFSGNHLLTLVNNVLELNKVESGKSKLDKLKFNLKNVIINIIDSLEFALTDNKNKIHLNYDERIPLVLLGDSLKLINENDTSVKLFFEVRDDGLGIPKEKQIKIFEDFYQENSRADNSYKGTGLGLSIVKRIVNAMGSDVTIHSEMGKGTSFNFELDFTKTESDFSSCKITDNGLKKDLKNKKILVVDDNKINQLVTKKILSQYEIISISVSSGIEAIEVLQHETFDCILMDLNMPELDGYQTTSRIKKQTS